MHHQEGYTRYAHEDAQTWSVSFLSSLLPEQYITTHVRTWQEFLKIPDSYQQTVRYYGVYSNKSRGMRKTQQIPEFMLVEDDEPSYGKSWSSILARDF